MRCVMLSPSLSRTCPFTVLPRCAPITPEVQALAARIEDRRIITYGFNPQADVRCVNLRTSPEGAVFDIAFEPPGGERVVWADLRLPMMGDHNVQNATGAVAIAQALGASEESARKALAGFLRA